MAGITLAQAEAKLTEYLNAETAVLAGQKVVIDGNEMSRANLDAIQKGIDIWDSRVKRLSASSGGGITVRRVGCLD